MTFRSRSGGPVKNRKPKKQTHTRKLHHPPPKRVEGEEEEESKPAIPPSAIPLPSCLGSGPFNPPDSEILALLHRALHETLSSDEFVPTVQRIKGLLYDKKWLDVFCGPQVVLESYAGRWVPSRACCFREVMDKLVNQIFTGEERALGLEESMADLDVDDEQSEDDDEEADEDEDDDESGEEDETGQEPREDADVDEGEQTEEEGQAESSRQATTELQTQHILSLGGGAGSELLAITALIRSVLISRPHSHPNFTWTGIDIGNWHNVLTKIEDAVRVDWKIGSELLHVEYIKGDLLALPPSSNSEPNPKSTTKTDTATDVEPATSERRQSQIPDHVDLVKVLSNKPPKLITLFFTLTELLTQSRARTLSVLNTLTQHTPSGSYFLVIDSASDISDFSLGKDGRKYPVYMVIDTLLTAKGRGWEKVRGEDSRWFRFGEGVGAGWKVKLENTRYWYRLYRRI
ncbi:uncharacterized protein I303_108211 [Kwoniella dejecticola CBS 10117]|uniref:Cytoplasmic protein n=1 Tax=Kwoniella dejecticola CBS 10117 TaxID=1296121 RepID=A0A1A5ZY34_9TREE|nr:cytoplasmic protein [Kwoniella dejecticola CBS 10117]OBR82698.1 cytoplasmic protein [Kwoniella dejecticola CBS 10117]